MSDITLNSHNFFATTTAVTTSNWVPMSYKYSGEQNRSISGFRSDVNCPFKVEVKTSVPLYNRDGSKNGFVDVTATVTTWASGSNHFSTGIILPATHIRVVKENASGAATVNGVI